MNAKESNELYSLRALCIKNSLSCFVVLHILRVPRSYKNGKLACRRHTLRKQHSTSSPLRRDVKESFECVMWTDNLLVQYHLPFHWVVFHSAWLQEISGQLLSFVVYSLIARSYRFFVLYFVRLFRVGPRGLFAKWSRYLVKTFPVMLSLGVRYLWTRRDRIKLILYLTPLNIIIGGITTPKALAHATVVTFSACSWEIRCTRLALFNKNSLSMA